MSTSAAPAEVVHTGSIAHRLVAATVVAIVVPTIALGLRLLARHVLRIRLYFDDWLIIIAWVRCLRSVSTSAAPCVNTPDIVRYLIIISNIITVIEHGMGRPAATVSGADLDAFLKIQFTGVIQYPLCVTFTKLSILYQYRRLFPNRDFKLMTSALIAIMIMWCTGVMFTGIFMCTPVHKAWKPFTPGSCISLVPYYYGMQIPNVITDLLILLLPFREIQRLELPFKQKIGVAVACFLWVISLVFGIIRLAVLVELKNQGHDATWILVNPAIWTTIEPAVQITCACLPSCRVLYRKYTDRNKKQPNSERLRSLSLSSRPRNGTFDGSSVGETTISGSWTTKDHNGRPAAKERDVYV
ncbi:hypothetical protein D6D06_03005 [Aureobasidium pullulans]|nr:hypothetical protein D6D06_03005 [Aureobasidium pullulans]